MRDTIWADKNIDVGVEADLVYIADVNHEVFMTRAEFEEVIVQYESQRRKEKE